MMKYFADTCAAIAAVVAVSISETSLAQVKGFDETTRRQQNMVVLQDENPSAATFSWSLSLNPSWGRRLDVQDDPITNQNALKFTLKVEQPISEVVYVAANVGGQADPKFATSVTVPGAGVFGQAKLGSRIRVGNSELPDKLRDTFDLGTTYKLTTGYKDDLDVATDNNFTDHQLGAEIAFTNVRYHRARSSELSAEQDVSASWKATAGYGRILSNLDLRDKHALTGTFDWNYAFHEQYPDINLQGAVERSLFDNKVNDQNRRETLYTVFGGVDLKKYSPFSGAQKLAVGVKLSRLKSSLAGADDTRVAFQLGFDFGS